MLKIHHFFAALAVATLFFSAAPALACSCVPQTVEQAKQDAVAIFEGRVTAIEAAPARGPDDAISELSVTLEVTRSWKGLNEQSTVTLRTAESGASCGFGFAQGTSYLIYAAGAPAQLEVHSCGRTQPMSAASEDLAVLGEGVAAGKREPARDTAPPATKSGGCASSKTSASAAPLFWVGASGMALFGSRRRR